MSNKKGHLPWSSLGKPFMEMTPAESAMAWEDIGNDLNQNILSEARGREGAGSTLVCAVLTQSSGERKVVYDGIDYGDGDGRESVEAFVDQVKKRGLIREGESLEIHETEITIALLGLE